MHSCSLVSILFSLCSACSFALIHVFIYHLNVSIIGLASSCTRFLVYTYFEIARFMFEWCKKANNIFITSTTVVVA